MGRTHLILPCIPPLLQAPKPDWRIPVLARYISALTDAWEKTRDEKLQERIERLIAFSETLR